VPHPPDTGISQVSGRNAAQAPPPEYLSSTSTSTSADGARAPPPGCLNGGQWRKCSAAPGGEVYCIAAEERRRILRERVDHFERTTGFDIGVVACSGSPSDVERAAREAKAELEASDGKSRADFWDIEGNRVSYYMVFQFGYIGCSQDSCCCFPAVHVRWLLED